MTIQTLIFALAIALAFAGVSRGAGRAGGVFQPQPAGDCAVVDPERIAAHISYGCLGLVLLSVAVFLGWVVWQMI